MTRRRRLQEVARRGLQIQRQVPIARADHRQHINLIEAADEASAPYIRYGTHALKLAILLAAWAGILTFGAATIAALLSSGVVSAGVTVGGIAFSGLVLPIAFARRTDAGRVNPRYAVFVGLIFWTFVWGIWGTLLAVPMLVVVKAFCDRVEDLKPVGELLGE